MNNQYLRRYTNLPSLLDIIQNKRITLLDPKSWDDKNDSYYIEQYKKIKNLKTVLALCFTTRGETYHHWKVFSDGPSGVCLVFKRQKLEQALLTNSKNNEIKIKEVNYKKINEIKSGKIELDDWPFIKRLPFSDEKEVRILYECSDKELMSKSYEITLDVIEKIIVSPWIPKALHISIQDAIKAICKSNNYSKTLRVYKTTLIDNDTWKNACQSIEIK